MTPAETRIELVSAAHQESTVGLARQNDLSIVDEHPDEYLLDGGDRALPIHYDRFNRLGLDTEDTVGEYTDHLGQQHVKASNRVAIYAPRFGAVRTVTVPGAGTSIALVANTNDVSRTHGLRNRLSPSDQTQRDTAGRMLVRSRASGLDGGVNRRGVYQSTALVQQVKPVGPFEKLAFVGSGRFVQSERARLATGIQAAAVWSRAKSPVILAQFDGLQEAYAWFKPQEIVGTEDERLTKGELRIVKLADRKTASPGDVITFTIRYDNLGDRELHHIRIIDNLTPRLEYIDDSAFRERSAWRIKALRWNFTKWVLPYFGELTRITDISPDDIEKFIHAQKARGVKNSTIWHYITDLRAMFNWAIKKTRRGAGYGITTNPVNDADLSMIRNRKVVKMPLDPKMVDRAAEALGGQDRIYFDCLRWTGLRKDEANRLQWKDLDLERDPGLMMVPGTKTEDSATVLPL
ncbi:MAG: hypothetical protein IH968_17185, partial [Gemmatimonadetes bacterium]|nr:hypothetical protein [Gemmatimonadota bacterium]